MDSRTISKARPLAALATVIALMGAMFMAFTQPAQAVMTPQDPQGMGRIGYYLGAGQQHFWLGTQVAKPESGGVVTYCIQAGTPPPKP